MQATFESWTRGREVASLGTNSGAPELPFQAWRNFKEAFAPELVARAITESRRTVRTCLDPFGGSGTTALACQFLGVEPATIEVNPYLADLIEAKLCQYDPDALARDLHRILRLERSLSIETIDLAGGLPPTLIEPGINDRWVFNWDIATKILHLRSAVENLANEKHRRLFRVLLGGILVGVSNVVISGKGRRYRSGKESKRRIHPREVNIQFCSAARQAITELYKYRGRACTTFEVIRGDSRKVLPMSSQYDLAVFSPPYPNSFDYTDVYNLELWMLGYLQGTESNRALRASTLCSHVQIKREYPRPPSTSSKLDGVLDDLRRQRKKLWNRWIPEMVGGYFADMNAVLQSLHQSLTSTASAWVVLGNSRYAGVLVDTSLIVAELSEAMGWTVETSEPFRSMRASPQQGGRPELCESLLVLRKA